MTEPTPHAQKKKHSRQMATSCESCGNFVYDDEYECYTCEVDLDEDEMARFLQDKFYNCPSVSYTHLDVYKRQEVTRPVSVSSAIFAAATLHCCSCLLYTSAPQSR